MKDYEKLKEIIQQANPEIMELTVEQNAIQTVAEMCKSLGDKIGLDAINVVTDLLNNEIGRPIRLADVLLALRASGKADYVRTDGLFCKWFKFASGESGHNEIKSTYIEWNLKDDNLDNQSEETKQFLINLLVK